MEKITSQQIATIEHVLIEVYSIKYEDTRNELIDHIACKIENEMSSNNISFDLALKITMRKWHFNLKPSNWILYGKIPYFIAKGWFKRDMVFFLTMIIITTLFTFGIDFLELNPIQLSYISCCMAGLSFIVNLLLIKLTKKIRDYRMQYIKNQVCLFLLPTMIITTISYIQFKSLSNTDFAFSGSVLFFTSLLTMLNMIYFGTIWNRQKPLIS